MNPWLIAILGIIFGLALLVIGGELLVKGASRLAAVMKISPLVIGLTVVAFGTSSPELAVSIQSALAGKADIALGNCVGSNIFNVLFILGISALVVPLLGKTLDVEWRALFIIQVVLYGLPLFLTCVAIWFAFSPVAFDTLRQVVEWSRPALSTLLPLLATIWQTSRGRRFRWPHWLGVCTWSVWHLVQLAV